MLTVLCGLPASGKTTWRLANGADTTVVCLDEVREELTGDAARQDFNESVMMVARGRARDALEEERDVIIDATGLTREHRATWLDLAEGADCSTRCIYFPVSIEEALERNAARDRQVPEDAIRRMAGRLEKPAFGEGFDEVLVLRDGRLEGLSGKA